MLGNKVKDVVTGFEGIAIGRVNYLTGCEQILVQPQVVKGVVPEARWIDADRLRTVKVDAVKFPVTKNGFDMAAPIK